MLTDFNQASFTAKNHKAVLERDFMLHRLDYKVVEATSKIVVICFKEKQFPYKEKDFAELKLFQKRMETHLALEKKFMEQKEMQWKNFLALLPTFPNKTLS
jgi:hypothetical protein